HGFSVAGERDAVARILDRLRELRLGIVQRPGRHLSGIATYRERFRLRIPRQRVRVIGGWPELHDLASIFRVNRLLLVLEFLGVFLVFRVLLVLRVGVFLVHWLLGFFRRLLHGLHAPDPNRAVH